MKERLKKYIFSLLLILSVTLFGAASSDMSNVSTGNEDGNGVTNEIITKNPDREVTTVESQRLRDKANMSLTITKIEPMALFGRRESGKLTTFIPLDIKNKRYLEDPSKLKLYVEGVSGEEKSEKLKINKNVKMNEEAMLELFKKNPQKKEKKEYNIEKIGNELKVTIENVSKDEHVYLSVVEGKKIVKAYKVKEIESRQELGQERVCWANALYQPGDRGKKLFKTHFFSGTEYTYSNGSLQGVTTKRIFGNEYKKVVLPQKGGGNTSGIRAISLDLKNGIVGEFLDTTKISDGLPLDGLDKYLNPRGRSFNISGPHGGEFSKGITSMKFFFPWKEENNITWGKVEDEASVGMMRVKFKTKDVSGKVKEEKAHSPWAHSNNLLGGDSVIEAFEMIEEWTGGQFNKEGEDYRVCTTDHSQYEFGVSSRNARLMSNLGVGFYLGVASSGNQLKLDYPGVYRIYTAELNMVRRFYVTSGSEEEGARVKVAGDIVIEDVDKHEEIVDFSNINVNDSYTLELNGNKGLSFMDLSSSTKGVYIYTDNPNQLTKISTNQNAPTQFSLGEDVKFSIYGTQKKGEFGKFNIKLLKNEANENNKNREFTLVQKVKLDGKMYTVRTVKIKMTLKPKIDIIELGTKAVKIDKRLYDARDKVGAWVYSDGTVANGIDGTRVELKDLINFEKFNLDKVNNNEEISNVTSMEGRPHKVNYFKNHSVFLINANTWTDEGATPKSGKMKEFNSKVTISMGNGTNTELLNNKFSLETMNNNIKKIYNGNIKEEYVGEGKTSGSGKLVLDAKGNKIVYSFPTTYNGNEVEGSDSSNNKIVMTEVKGKLLNGNTLGQITGTPRLLANKISVGDSKASKEVTVDGIVFGIGANGGLTIKKESDTNINSGKTYTIKFYHSASNKDIELSTFDLTVKIDELTKDLGTKTVKIDKRLYDVRNKVGAWVYSDGTVANGIDGTRVAFKDFIKFENFNLSSVAENENISRVTSMEGRPHRIDSFKNHSVFLTKSGVWLDEGATPKSGKMKEFNNKMTISMGNKAVNPLLDNKFSLKTTAGKTYNGNIKEEYVGEGKTSGEGSVILKDKHDNIIYTFAPGATGGTVESINGNKEKLQITNVTGKLPNGNNLSQIEATKVIANKLSVGNNFSNTGAKEVTVDGIVFGIGANGGLTLKKENTTASSEEKEYTIKFYYAPTGISEKDVELSTFTLKIKVEKIEKQTKNLGTVTANIDERMLQIPQSYSWISLDGKVSNLDKNKLKGDFSNFIATEGQFANNDIYRADEITEVLQINGQVPTITAEGIYKKLGGANEAAVPFKKDTNTNITIGDFIKLENGTKLVVSKYDINSASHNGKNEFKIKGSLKENKIVEYTGNIQEKYKGKNKEISLPTSSNEKRFYKGQGSLNLSEAELNKEYSFATDKTGNVQSTPQKLTLVIEENTSTLDATGIVKKQNENVANKMVVKVNGKSEAVQLSGNKLEKTILDGKLKVGINSKGEMFVAKLKHENISETTIVIEYFYDSDADNNIPSGDNYIKLGEFTLKLNNPIINLGTKTVKIDKRLYEARSTVGAWVYSDGKVADKIDGTRVNFKELVNFEQFTLTGVEDAEDISRVISMEGRPHRIDTFRNHSVFLLQNNVWSDEGATPRNGKMKNFNNNITISMGNKDNNPLLDNKFSLRTNAGKIYNGNIKEEYVGEGRTSGKGKVTLGNTDNEIKYEFPITYTGSEVEGSSSSNKKLKMSEVSGKLPNGNNLTEIETTSKVIANKIGVGNTKSSNGSKEVTVDGITFGIGTNGGLTLKKGTTNFTEEKEYTIKFYYAPTGATGKDVELSTFNLKINILASKDLGTVNVNIDERLLQVEQSYSWITLDGKISNLDNKKLNGDFSNFLKVDGNFKNNDINKADKIVEIVKINNQTPNATAEGIYKKLNGVNEAAFPFKKNSSENITLGEFINTSNGTKLLVSKYDITKSEHNGKNEFKIKGESKTEYTGNIQEKYKNKNGDVSLPIASGKETFYRGQGSLNLSQAELNKEYSFATDRNGNVESKPTKLTLKLDTNSSTLDATGVVTSQANNIANKMVIQVGNGSKEVVQVSGNRLEKEILNGKVKVGINAQGELFVTKLKNENISETAVVIEYFYDGNNNKQVPNLNNSVKLGQFTLKLESPVIDMGTKIVKIDRRLADAKEVVGSWLHSNGQVSNGVDAQKVDVKGFVNFEKFNQNGNTDETISEVISMEGRPYRSGNYSKHSVFLVQNGSWFDEGATPRNGKMSEFNNNLIVSMYNKAQSPLLENKFSLRTNAGKIYNGNVKEEYVGEGKTTGKGNITFKKENNGVTYKFEAGKSGTVIGKDETTQKQISLTVTEGKLLDGNTLQGVKNKVELIANKITVNGSTVNEKKEVTLDGITFGIGANGGLTLKNGNSADHSAQKEYTIKFFYVPNGVTNKAIELSTFNLTIKIEKEEIIVEDLGKFITEVDPRIKQVLNKAQKEELWVVSNKGVVIGEPSQSNKQVKLRQFVNLKNNDVTSAEYDEVKKVDNTLRDESSSTNDYAIFKKENKRFMIIPQNKTGNLNAKDKMANETLFKVEDTKTNKISHSINFENTETNSNSTRHMKVQGEIEFLDSTIPMAGYKGTGELALENANLKRQYTFKPGESSASSGGSTITITNIGAGSQMIDARGKVGNYKNESIATGIAVTSKDLDKKSVNDAVILLDPRRLTATVEQRNPNGEEVGKIEIGISSEGGLTIKKHTDGEFNQRVTVTYHTSYGSGNDKSIQLGEVTLDIHNKKKN